MGVKELQERLGLGFDRPSFLLDALTHPSFLNENPSIEIASYQRLEFLGDAVLGFLVAQELYLRHLQMPEGELTRLRSHLVQTGSLAGLAASFELGDHLRMGRGEEDNGGRHRESNLAAAFEALVGALFLDRGIDIARAFVLAQMSGLMDQTEVAGAPLDPKSHLQEMVQAQGGEHPQYRVTAAEGPDHDRTFLVEVLVEGRVLGSGAGKRKLSAEQEAAQRAIEALTSHTGSSK